MTAFSEVPTAVSKLCVDLWCTTQAWCTQPSYTATLFRPTCFLSSMMYGRWQLYYVPGHPEAEQCLQITEFYWLDTVLGSNLQWGKGSWRQVTSTLLEAVHTPDRLLFKNMLISSWLLLIRSIYSIFHVSFTNFSAQPSSRNKTKRMPNFNR